MNKSSKIKESDIAQICVNYLETKGYTVYKEVTMNGKGGRRADIYGTMGDISIIVEAKMSFSLKVIEQAYNWRVNANRAYICIPKPKRSGRKSFNFGLKVCKELGIGVITVDYNMQDCNIELESNYHENIKRPVLYDAQKNSVAGNDESKFHSAFKETCLNFDKYMIDKDNIKLSEIIDNIKHHYASKVSAQSSLKKMIELNILPYIYDKGYIKKS